MSMFPIGSMLCIDPIALPWDTQHHWQSSLMDAFFRSVSEERKLILSENDLIGEYCTWEGIQCQEGRVTTVKYSFLNGGNFNIYSLPPSVTFLQVVKCKQKYKFTPRALPRDVMHVWLHMNLLYGRLDLANIPRKTVQFSIWDNHLKGPIALVNLPDTLCSLLVARNRIYQSVIFYSKLPPNLEDIQLLYQEEKRKFRELKALDPADVIINKKIVHGIREENIH